MPQSLDRLAHRGPDQAGEFCSPDGRVWLGHRRLSIIDLSDAGRQPMANEDGSLRLIANGEIYNYTELRKELIARGHRFSSQSDSEVILHLYEESGQLGFSRLRGMYAFALYDGKSGQTILSRDPLGIKPLYVQQNGTDATFASELRAFGTLSAEERDLRGMASFLLFGCIQQPLTQYANCRMLHPGETLILGEAPPTAEDHLRTLVETAADATPDLEMLRHALDDSVRRHLVSDAPIGLFLSGGIDSGALALFASRICPEQLRAACVTVPGHPMSEGELAAETAAACGIDLQHIPFSQSDFEGAFDHFFEHLDMPSVDGFNTYIVSRAAREAGLTVALSGLGGDELFAGYPTFTWDRNFRRAAYIAGLMGRISRRTAAGLLRTFNKSSGGRRVADILAEKQVDRRTAWLAFRGLFLGSALHNLCSEPLLKAAATEMERFYDAFAWVESPSIPDALAVSALEIGGYMTPMLLRDTDVMSMAHSLEVRVPFVDMEVMRAALPLLKTPPAGDGAPKGWLRQALPESLPRAVTHRRKQGFSFPWQEWMMGRVAEELREQAKSAQSPLSATSIASLLEEYKRGRSHWRTVWAVYVATRMLSESG